MLYFADGSELHMREFVDVSMGIDRFKYSYHYMRGEQMIFRYDNAADTTARDISTYPHHKHAGVNVHTSHTPTLQEVLEEILLALL